MTGPKVSVVVPTRDRQQGLRTLLESLAAQELPCEDYEVVVVDDGSPAPAHALVEEFATDAGLDLLMLRHRGSRGPAAARNTGWRAARGALIAFTDDDCRVDAGWLRALLNRYDGANDLIVQGGTRPDPGHSAPLSPFSRTTRIGGPNQLYATCNIAYPRALLERVGGFDERYRRPWGEDVDLGWRARKTGGRLVYCEEAVVYHAVSDPGLWPTIRRTMMRGDAVRLVRDHQEARGMLTARYFWRPTHPPLLLALAGVVAAGIGRRPSVALLSLVPYLMHYRRRYAHHSRPWAFAGRYLPRHLVIDLAEVGTMLVASVRHRTLVL